MESPTSSVSTASSFGENFEHNMWNPLLELLFLEQTSGVIVLYVEEIDLAKIHSLVILPLIYSATKKVVTTIMNDTSSGTIA